MKLVDFEEFGGRRVAVNPEQVRHITADDNGQTIIHFSNEHRIWVKESFSDVQRALS